MTGDGSGEIAERTDELAGIAVEYLPNRVPETEVEWDHKPEPAQAFPGSDDELLAALREDDRFAALFDGATIPAGKDGDSDLDFALCCQLAELAGPDPQRIERLWGMSALARRRKFQRWDYRTGTVRRAVAAVWEAQEIRRRPLENDDTTKPKTPVEIRRVRGALRTTTNSRRPRGRIRSARS